MTPLSLLPCARCAQVGQPVAEPCPGVCVACWRRLVAELGPRYLALLERHGDERAWFVLVAELLGFGMGMEAAKEAVRTHARAAMLDAS